MDESNSGEINTCPPAFTILCDVRVGPSRGRHNEFGYLLRCANAPDQIMSFCGDIILLKIDDHFHLFDIRGEGALSRLDSGSEEGEGFHSGTILGPQVLAFAQRHREDEFRFCLSDGKGVSLAIIQ